MTNDPDRIAELEHALRKAVDGLRTYAFRLSRVSSGLGDPSSALSPGISIARIAELRKLLAP